MIRIRLLLAYSALGIFLVLPFYRAAVASTPPPPTVFQVEVTSQNLVIPFSELPGRSPGVQVDSVERPVLYGELAQGVAAFTYTPSLEFWERGEDSFAYAVTQADGSTSVSRVMLLAGLHGGAVTLSEDFESGSPGALSTIGSVGISPTMAVSGTLGAEITVDTSAPESCVYWLASSTGIGGNQGNRIRVLTVPPDPVALDYREIVLASARTQGTSEDLMQIQLKDDFGQLALRGQVRENETAPWVSTSWYSIDSLSHRLEIDWWPVSASPEHTSGFFFWVDDHLVDGFYQNQEFDSGRLEFSFGIQKASSGPLTLGLDGIEILQGDVEPAYAPVMNDDFEGSELTRWTLIPDEAGSVKLSEESAITGRWGMGVDLTLAEAETQYLLDSTPSATKRYAAKVQVDTRDADLQPCDAVLILSATDEDALTSASEHLKILLRRSCSEADTFEIRGRARLDSGVWQSSSWKPLSDGTHIIEVDWRAASGSYSSDGYLRLWVDGTRTVDVTGLANPNRVVEAAILGGLGVDAGSTGSLYFDDFESWTPQTPQSP